MNRGIYSAASGMTSLQEWLDVASNNLANVNTTGFKRDELTFRDAMERELRPAGGGHALGSMGAGAISFSAHTVMEGGAVQATGNPLDLAIEDPRGMFAVETPRGLRYTRDGAFKLDPQGMLVTQQGHPVLDDTLSPIGPLTGALRVDANGEVFADGDSVARIGVFAGAFRKEGGNLFQSGNAEPLEESRVAPGALESSNVNPIEAMIAMITVQRAFELSQKTISQQDELTQRLIQSLQER